MDNQPEPSRRRWVGTYVSRRYPTPPYGGTFDLTLLWPAAGGRALSGVVRLADSSQSKPVEAPVVGGLVGDRRLLLTARWDDRLLTLTLVVDPETQHLLGDYDTNEPVDGGAVRARRFDENARWCGLL